MFANVLLKEGDVEDWMYRCRLWKVELIGDLVDAGNDLVRPIKPWSELEIPTKQQ